MKFKAIITGTTGMVGEGVLMECLSNPDVEKILVINRKPCGYTDPKLIEIIHNDFFNLTGIADQLAGYDACFFCLGVSSVGISKEIYRHMTYDLTINFAEVLVKHNPDLTMCYVSGAHTDSTEQGTTAWARVKGATENVLLKLFTKAYMFRPGFMKETDGQKNIKSFYKYIAWMYPIGRAVYPAGFCTLKEVAQAMIKSVSVGYTKRILEVPDIVLLAAK